MVDTIKFHLVSPERKLAAFEAISVTLPGIEGDMTVFPNHSTLLTSLRPGILSVRSADGIHEFLVTGGFADITGLVVTVLAEKSVPKFEADRALILSLIEKAKEDVAAENENKKARLALRINDLEVLNGLIE